jgi:hypothetical protein
MFFPNFASTVHFRERVAVGTRHGHPNASGKRPIKSVEAGNETIHATILY